MPLFYDILITTGIFATTAPAIILLYHLKRDSGSWESRHKKTTCTLITVFFLGTIILVYGSFIEPRLLVTNEQMIDIPGIETPFTIALIADIQVGPYKQSTYVEKIVDQILTLQPDIVMIAGDHTENGEDKDEIPYLEPLKHLTKKIPTYAVHGNHEYGVWTSEGADDFRLRHINRSSETKTAMEALGIRYLVNEIETISVKDQEFYLFGPDAFWSGLIDYSALEKRNRDIPTISLIHNPAATQEIQARNVTLMLAGHTHGGQIRLPILGPIGRADTKKNIPLAWYQGLSTVASMQLFVTSGVGEGGVRARLFNPPEIVLLTIK